MVRTLFLFPIADYFKVIQAQSCIVHGNQKEWKIRHLVCKSKQANPLTVSLLHSSRSQCSIGNSPFQYHNTIDVTLSGSEPEVDSRKKMTIDVNGKDWVHPM